MEEFTVVDESALTLPDGRTRNCEVEDVFSAGSQSVFRLTRERSQGCVCERIEQAGRPVRDVTAVDGTLCVTFFARDRAALQSVLTALDETHDDIHVRRLLSSAREEPDERPVLVDLGALTERQQEVLATAHGMGYFEHPKEATAAEVADALGISPSTLTEHLAAARRNLLAELTGKWS